ncbi:MAG: GAF domain-containing protein [Betaproteobacteria bacterium]
MSSGVGEAPLRWVAGNLRHVARFASPRAVYVLIALLLLGLGLAAARYHAEVRAEAGESVVARRLALAQLAAATLSERMDRMMDLAVSLATRVRFAELVGAGDWEAAIAILRGVPAEFPHVERIFLSDVRGTLMADVPPLGGVRGRSFADRDWYQGVSREWRTHISTVYRRAAEPQRNVIAVAAPVRASGRVAGILVVQLSLEAFFDWPDDIELPDAVVLAIADAKGQRAYATGTSTQAPIADLSGHPAVARLRSGRSGVELVGGQLHAFVAAKHGWSVVLQQPAHVAFAARDMQLRLVWISYGLVAMFLLAVAWLGTRLAGERREELARAQRSLSRHTERLRILHEIDGAIVAQQSPEAIAAAVIGPLRELLGVPRAIVNKFDLDAGEAEWIAAAGRRRMHVGPGVRYSIRLMGDIEALRRGEPQRIDVQALPPGPEREALLASDVRVYMVMPMIAGGELIGALSFGSRAGDFPPEQLAIAQEVATQLAIAIAQARLHERVQRHAEELERRVAQRTAALDAANREYEDLYNKAPCGYHSVDRHGKFVRMNDTELRWLGYRRDEVIGRMGPADLHTPESLERFEERFARFKQTGIAQDVDYEFRRKDGSVMPVVLSATAVRDANGEFVMSRSTIFDNTERRRAEQALRDSERELRMLHAAALEIGGAGGSAEALAVLLRKVCDYAGWAFAQAWLPYGDRLELGRAWYSRVPALEAFRKANEQLGAAPRGGALEGVWRNKEPGWVWDLQPAPGAVRRPLMIEAGLRSWIGFPVLADGEVIAVIEFFDHELREREAAVLRLIAILASQVGPVIRRKRAEEQIEALNESLKRYTGQLEASNKELESFSYSVSHDLRAPLRAIDGFARMLEEDYGGRLDEEGRRLLGVVRSSSRHMGQLMDDLLDFSRLGRQELNKQDIDMPALAREAARELGAEPEIGQLPAAHADRTLLRQVWLNLIGNAVKYSAKRAAPRIEVGGRDDAKESLYWVRDNGVGFDMRYARKLFGVFQRLHGADEFPGTGVGLAIVQRVVSRHGGRVWAEGRAGEGACFYFSLPRRA